MSSPFFKLPRELRDEIYRCYLTHDGGYVYNPRTRKLRTTDGTIDLAWMRTCKQVAHEMRPLMFEINTVTFRTEWIDRETSERAGRFSAAFSFLYAWAGCMSYDLRERITDEMASRVESTLPQCISMLRLLRTHVYGRPFMGDLNFWPRWRQAPSTMRKLIKTLMQQDWSGLKDSGRCLEESYDESDIPSKLVQVPDPWVLDEEARTSLETLCEFWGARWDDELSRRLDTTKHIKRYLSATALAVNFIESLDQNVRSRLRRVVLDEFHASEPHPECHAFGLIPILRKNPNLHVEQRVDIWNNVFIGQLAKQNIENFASTSGRLDDIPQNAIPIVLADVSRAFAPWFEEAIAVQAAGMPSDRFSLIFRSETIENTLSVLTAVVRDAAWQSAVEKACANAPITTAARLFIPCYFAESFTRVVREIEQGKGIVSFDVRGLPVNESVKIDLADKSPEEIGRLWLSAANDVDIRPLDPLPDWQTMLFSYIKDV